METVYEVSPFNIQTITMERIFVDKLFAAEAYVRKSSVEHRAFEAAKHIYDLAVLSHNPKIELLMADPVQMEHLLDIRLEEEAGRLDGIPGVAPSEFTFFQSAKDNADVQRAYETMQNQYVLREQDRIAFSYATQELLLIEQKLLKNPAWTERTVSPQKAAEDEQ